MSSVLRPSADRPTNLYVGVLNQHSELTMLVQHLLANLTGTTVNITQENCNYQREDEQDKANKHVRPSVFILGQMIKNKSTVLQKVEMCVSDQAATN